jgi:hydrogenase expression/formation protein HypC
MCIGIPMCVLAVADGRAQARGRDGEQTVDTRLVGRVEPGQWLLVFQGAAREALPASRAHEIDAALDLLAAALAGDAAGAAADPGFALPSAMDPAALAALAGAPSRAALAGAPTRAALVGAPTVASLAGAPARALEPTGDPA